MNMRRKRMSQLRHAAALAADSERRVEIIDKIPLDRVDVITEGFELDGAISVERERKLDGNYTVRAYFA